MAHGSQISESWFGRTPPELGERVFGAESFIRAMDSTGAPVPETIFSRACARRSPSRPADRVR